MKFRIAGLLVMGLISIYVSGCGSSAGQEDVSTSGNVGGTLGGSYASSGGGTSSSFYEPGTGKSKFQLADLFEILLPKALASGVCPIIATGGSNCAVASNTATLTYSACSFSGSPAVWSGSQAVAFTGATPVCGSAFPTTMTQVTRTFANGTTRTSGPGTLVTMDTNGLVTAADGNNYSGGIEITFLGGTRTGILIPGIDLVAVGKFSHTITTAAGGSPLVLTGGNTIASGTVITWHNLAKVKGASTFNSVVFSPLCCHPVSGSITTVFSTINGVTPLIPRFSGATETLTYTGCGTATYQGPEGYSGNVNLGHCI